MTQGKRCAACNKSIPKDARFCPHCGVEAATGMRFVAGARVGKYTLGRKIGQGGMGVVFEARHADLDRIVALKVLTLSEVDSDEAARRFRREARLASRLEHPGAVTIHDFFDSPEGMPCLVMELVDGYSVRTAVERDGPFPLARAVRVGERVLGVLAAAHEIGLVHRDITSRNVMLVDDEEEEDVKVLDFGIAKMVNPGEGTGMTPLTEEGTVLGSPQYMSPEQSRGDPVDGRSDLYSLGIVMYEMLTGHVPFDSTRAMDVLLQQVQAEPPPLPADLVPADLRRILERALRKDPEERHPDAESLRDALEEFRRTHREDLTSESTRRVVAARLLPLDGEPAVPIRDTLRLGRGGDCSFVVAGERARRVSTEHAELFWRDGELWVRDLDSTNGTYLDGRRVTEERIAGKAVLRLARKGPAYRVELVGDRSRLARWLDEARVWLVETSGRWRRILTGG